MNELLPSSDFQTMVGIPLWEEVKKSIYSYWLESNDFLYLIDQKRVQTKLSEHALGSNVDKFKASVLRLYRACRSKLYYHRKNESVKKLQELKLDNYYIDPDKLDLVSALQAFTLLTDFLEIDGVTKFEDAKSDPEHAAMAELS